MADTFTTRMGLIMQAYGGNPETWGTELNNAMIALVDDSVAYDPITVNSDVTLTADNGLTNQVRRHLLVFTGDGGHTVTVKDVDRWYLVHNRCSADITIKPDGGTGSVVRAGTCVVWATDGSTSLTADVPLDKIAKPEADVDFNGKKITNLGEGAIGSSEAPTVAQVEEMIASATINLPSQVGHAGAVLATDGDDPFWDPNVPRINAAQTYSKPQRVDVKPLTYASTVTIDLNEGNSFELTMSGNPVIANPTNMSAGVGQEITIFFRGEHQPSFGSYWKFPGGDAPTFDGDLNVVGGYVASDTEITAFCGAGMA